MTRSGRRSLAGAHPRRGPPRPRGASPSSATPTTSARSAAALPHCDGILASAQPLRDLVESGAITSAHRTYLSINRTGLAGAAWELDDRLVATVARAAADGYSGVKIMTRIDLGDPHTAGALELLGRVLEEARAAGLEALVEAVTWRDGRMSHDADDIVHAAVIAHDLGAPLLKVPVPERGDDRATGVAADRARRGQRRGAGAVPRWTASPRRRRTRSSTRPARWWPAAGPGWPSVGPSCSIPIRPAPWPTGRRRHPRLTPAAA